ncbi:MAG: tRNA lysidine(34) synthetase TilS [Oscillospiraceae bacterium]|nr:tRNA lysidine(34) synthetase TilS [Oscillospiraceae bacterium]
MKAKVLDFCRREGLFSPGDRVICALSGGADSVALLAVLLELREELQISVEAAHFHHNLRGTEADRDAAFCRSLCQGLQIPFHLGKADSTAYQSGESLELRARQLRYGFLRSLPCDRIATAHTADDNTETVLQHLLRGSGLRGLSGIPVKTEILVRPLLPVTREEIETYLREKALTWVEDSTNREDFCQRNRLRHRVIPALQWEQPGLHSQVFRQSCLLRREDAFLDRLAEDLLQKAQTGECCYDRQILLRADPVLCDRALRLLLRSFYPADLAMAHVEELRKLLQSAKPSAQLSLPRGLMAQRRYGQLQIRERRAWSFPTTALQIPGETIIEDTGVKICCFFCENLQNFANTPFHFAVKYDMITQSRIFVRQRQEGDRFLMNGGFHKSLKKLLIEKKIPCDLRQRLPVFTSGQALLGVGGIGVSADHRAEEGQPALIISIEI